MHYYTKTIFGYVLAFAVLISGINTFQPTIITIAQSVDSDFNKNFLLSDESFSTNIIFPNEKSIQEYLERVNSPLKNYDTEGAKASHWIYTAARGITSSAYNVKPNLNPAVILTYLEKEQSLLTNTNYDINTDPDNRIKTAMGYGCPDNFSCAEKYKGFINQVNYAAYQLQYNYNISTKNPNEKFRVGNTIKTFDNQDVTLANAATAAIYRYTPHVYYSGYNLWKIMTVNKWGSTGQIYQGSFFDNSPSNTTLLDRFKVTFDDDVIYKPIQSKANVSIVMTDPQSEMQKQNNCDELFKKNWTFGEENTEVEKLQQCLIDKNVFDHVITGYFGPITRAGLEKVRKNLSSQVSVIPNQSNSSNGVIVITAPTNSTPAVQDNCNKLKQQQWIYGTTSDEVEKLQRCMQKIGVFKHIYGATGYFGPVTQKALDTWRGMA
jgi:hypothetical protein